MQIPKELTRVTPLSKSLALLMFILLPFIAFLWGIKFQAYQQTTSTPTSYPTGNSANYNQYFNNTLIEDSISPIGNNSGGKRFLKDDKCLTTSDVDITDWGLYQASRNYLIDSGYHPDYIDKHFCPLHIQYDKKQGWARVTYKALFQPYYAWWQHGFPFVKDINSTPKLTNGHASVDFSCKECIHQIPVSEIKSVSTPEELKKLIINLIGSFQKSMQIQMGPGVGSNIMRLYAVVVDKNPNSKSCNDTERIVSIDIETGKGNISYSGACPEFSR